MPTGFLTLPLGVHFLGKSLRVNNGLRSTGHRHTLLLTVIGTLCSNSPTAQAEAEPLSPTLLPSLCMLHSLIFLQACQAWLPLASPSLSQQAPVSLCLHPITRIRGKVDSPLCWLRERAGVTACNKLLVPRLCATRLAGSPR